MTLHVPAAKVHDVALNEPVLFDVKLTLPVGVTAPAPEASATVTVQVVADPVFTEAGEQVTAVVVARLVEARLNEPLLPR